MIAIVDYGVGNLFSLASSLEYLGIAATVTADKSEIENADSVILPGVGAFADAAQKLKDSGLVGTIKNEAKKKPLLGICLGMQLLFDCSLEYGEHEGLSLIDGKVVPFELPEGMKVPHMGWNSLDFKRWDCPLLKYVKDGDWVYYVHSYYAQTAAQNIVATSFYGIDFTSLVQKGNVFGAQFHPEKSGDVGLRMLKAFGELK